MHAIMSVWARVRARARAWVARSRGWSRVRVRIACEMGGACAAGVRVGCQLPMRPWHRIFCVLMRPDVCVRSCNRRESRARHPCRTDQHGGHTHLPTTLRFSASVPERCCASSQKAGRLFPQLIRASLAKIGRNLAEIQLTVTKLCATSAESGQLESGIDYIRTELDRVLAKLDRCWTNPVRGVTEVKQNWCESINVLRTQSLFTKVGSEFLALAVMSRRIRLTLGQVGPGTSKLRSMPIEFRPKSAKFGPEFRRVWANKARGTIMILDRLVGNVA